MKTIKKFNKYGRGIMTGYNRPGGITDRKQAQEYLYPELCNPSLFSLGNIKGLMGKLHARIQMHVSVPGVFDKEPIYITHRTPEGELIEFTCKEAFDLLTAAALAQKETKQIIETKERLNAVKAELASLETRKEKKERLEAEYLALLEKL